MQKAEPVCDYDIDMNYRDIYEWGKKQLLDADIPEAELDARLLLEYVCGTDRSALFAHGDMDVTAQQRADYETCISRRSKHEPLQHITGEQNFMGLDFLVNEHVLIPRQDTEILVEEVMLDLHDGMRILDMCTGSGCILISLLQYSNDCTGVGADASEEALQVARQNAQRLGKNEAAEFVCSNLFEQVEGKFDIIVSNPPYIRTDVIETLMPEVRDHEPRMALDGYEDGLYFYREIIRQAGTHLCHGGRLYFEIGYDQAQQVSELMRQMGFGEITVKQDYAHLDRVVYGTYIM